MWWQRCFRHFHVFLVFQVEPDFEGEDVQKLNEEDLPSGEELDNTIDSDESDVESDSEATHDSAVGVSAIGQRADNETMTASLTPADSETTGASASDGQPGTPRTSNRNSNRRLAKGRDLTESGNYAEYSDQTHKTERKSKRRPVAMKTSSGTFTVEEVASPKSAGKRWSFQI